jgi:hypothetical protein
VGRHDDSVHTAVAEPVEVRTRTVRVLLGGLGAGGWMMLAGYGVVAAPVLLAWVAAGANEPMPDVLSVAADGWLLGLGATLTTSLAAVGLAPLGLTLVALVLVARGASWALEWAQVRDRSAALLLVASTAVAAGTMAAGMAALSTLEISADPGEAAAVAGLVAAGGAAVAAVRAVGLGEPEHRWARLAVDATRLAARPAAAALAVLLAAAGALLTAALVVGFPVISDLVAQVDPGVAGAVALLAASVAYLPTAVVWAAGVLLGPGAAVGSDVVVRSGGEVTGVLPGAPLLGAVPTGVPGWLGPGGLVILLIGGLVAGLLLRRAHAGVPATAVSGVLVGLLAGVAVGVACWAASGPMGPGTLASVGVPPAPAAGLTALVVATAATATATLAEVWAARRA